MAGSSVIGALRVVLGLDSAQFTQGLSAAQKELAKAGKNLERIGGQISGVGRTLSIGLTAPIVAAGAGVIKMAGDFEKSMNKVSIASQASTEDLKAMEKQALAIGKSTVFSASEAADAMEMLAKNGVGVREILNGAAEATTNLAAAADSGLEPAAAAISDTMAQFKVTAADLPMVVNQITGAVNESKLDFSDFQLAMAQAGGVAANLGVEFEDFNAVLAGTSPLFASGSDAGTSFKTFLTSLVPKSKAAGEAMILYGLSFFDAAGNMKSMGDIAQMLQDKLAGLSEQQRNEVLKDIFGTDAMRTAIGLMDLGAAGIDNIRTKIAETDAAAQAAQQMAGFNGQLEQLRGALETLAITIGQSGLLEFVTGLVERLSGFVDRLAETNPEILKWGTVLAAAAAAIGPLLMVVGGAVSAIGGLLPVIGPVVAILTGPWGLAIAAAVAAVVLFKDEIAAFGKEVWEAIGPKIKPLFEALKGLVVTVGQAIAAVFGGSGEASASVKFWGDLVGAVLASVLDILTGTINNITSVFKALGALLRGDFSGAWAHLKEIATTNVDTLLKVIENFAPGAVQAMKMLFTGVKLWLQDKLGGVFNWVADKLKLVGDKFFELYDRVVGHSYVPDMVDGIEKHMARLDAVMVKPAKTAAERTAKAFEDLQQRVGQVWENLLSDQEKAMREFSRNSRTLREGLQAGLLSEEQYRELHNRLWNRSNPITGMKAPIPGGDLKTIKEANDNWQRALDDQEDAYEDALGSMGQSFRGFFQEMITTGKADWKRLLLDLTSDWKGTMSVLSRMGGQLGGGLGKALSGIGGFLGRVGGSAGIGQAIGSAMGLGTGNGMADLGLSIAGGIAGTALAGSMLGGTIAAGIANGVVALGGSAALAGGMGMLLSSAAVLGPIGAIAALALGGLFKSKPSNNGALATFSGDGYSLSGNKRTSETEGMAKAAAEAILQGQAMLRAAGATLSATVQSIDIGTRDATDIILSTGQALTAKVGDAAAAAETGLMAVLQGATFANEAQTKLVQSMLAAGAGFDAIVTQLAQFAEAQAAAAGLSRELDDAILKLTDAKAYELEMLKREQEARRAHIRSLLEAAVITQAAFAGYAAQLDVLEKLELDNLTKSLAEPIAAAETFASSVSEAAASVEKAKDGWDRLRDWAKGLVSGPASGLTPVAQARAAQAAWAESVRTGSEDMATTAQGWLDAFRAIAPDAASYAREVAKVKAVANTGRPVDVGGFSRQQLAISGAGTSHERVRLADGAEGDTEALASSIARLEANMVASNGRLRKIETFFARVEGEGMPVRGLAPGEPVRTEAA